MSDGTIYSRHQSTLKHMSFDETHKEYMSEDETVVVYDYDGVVKDYASREHIFKPCSNDALYIDDERITFIEFKNGTVKAKQLLQKAYDSLFVLFDQDMGLEWRRADFCSNISFSRKNIDYILVWEDPDKDPKTADRQKIKNHVRKNSKFYLNTLSPYLYKQVHIMSKVEFQQEFVERVKFHIGEQ